MKFTIAAAAISLLALGLPATAQQENPPGVPPHSGQAGAAAQTNGAMSNGAMTNHTMTNGAASGSAMSDHAMANGSMSAGMHNGTKAKKTKKTSAMSNSTGDMAMSGAMSSKSTGTKPSGQ